MTKKYDLIGMGEPLLRLAPPGFGQLRRTELLEIRLAGSQMNVVANLARLGKKTALVTKLPNNALGLLSKDLLMSYGVDVSHVKLISGSRMGVIYVEQSVAPRPPLSVYDRAGSASSTVSKEDYDWDVMLADAHFAYTDGIFSGLSSQTKSATSAFLESAKRVGATTCFDMNYRAHLFTPEQAKTIWSNMLDKIDILVTNRNASEDIFGYHGTDQEIMQQYVDHFGCRYVCMTYREVDGLQKGAWNSHVLADGELYRGKRRAFDIVDRYGTGDAWFSGFLFSLMQQKDIEECLNFGNALCSLAHTTNGDVINFTIDQILDAMEDVPDVRVKR